MTSPAAATILIVDDELQNRRLLELMLKPEGYATQTAANGEEALTLVAQQPPDLILLDIMMPDMDGYAVARVLKANPATANIPIIMVTAQIDRFARVAGLDAGAEEFLTKPVDRAELWLRVRNLLRLKVLGDFFQNHSVMLEQQVQARAAELQRFRSAMDMSADAILLVSRESMHFVDMNATACSMLGYTREEFFAMGPTQILRVTLGELEQVYDATISGGAGREKKEVEVRRKDGSLVLVELHQHAQRSGTDWIIVAVLHDLAERIEAQARLEHLAHYDSLTGLPNRRLYFETLRIALTKSLHKGWSLAVLIIDIDFFKNVNDSLGHAVGDDLLAQLSNRLIQCVRLRDTVGRLDADEFGIILIRQDGLPVPSRVATEVLDALRAPFYVEGNEVVLTASIGIAVYPDDGSDADALLKYADTAMCHAKQSGRDTYRFFTAKMNAEVLARIDLESALRKALAANEFVLHYQPKVKLDSGLVVGLEALLRWQRPGHGLVSPSEFIPVLEESGLIVRVGSWVVAEACKQIGLWMRSSIGRVAVSVNVAGRQFAEGDLEGDVRQALADSGIAPELLELELTESSLMANTERTISTLNNLKTMGVQISIDDFGTGYSSLAYLRRFPIDKLKIDIAFIRDITTNPDDAAIARAIISMAHNLRMDVIAEGVETVPQLEYLRRHHCDQIQGFLFSKPLPLNSLEQILLDGKRLPRPDNDPGIPRMTLLLVDDDAHVLSALQRLFQPDGYQILSAHSAAEGFELLALHPVQVILCDQRMPDMNGTTFLSRVKFLYPDTFRIILSGYSDLESIMDAINKGALYRFYTKPWDNDMLRANIREAFRHYWLVHGWQSP